ncbi:hypothetical protein EJ110_NYTH44021 [Nymphaea thermarum]|nr:hypothetical protein EJ110_NYTH44021 [Nymphaea thermarum]
MAAEGKTEMQHEHKNTCNLFSYGSTVKLDAPKLEDRCWDKFGRTSAIPLGRGVACKQGKNSLQSPIRSIQAASSVVDGSLSSSNPETVTVNINKLEYEEFLTQRYTQSSASTVMIDSVISGTIHPHVRRCSPFLSLFTVYCSSPDTVHPFTIARHGSSFHYSTFTVPRPTNVSAAFDAFPDHRPSLTPPPGPPPELPPVAASASARRCRLNFRPSPLSLFLPFPGIVSASRLCFNQRLPTLLPQPLFTSRHFFFSCRRPCLSSRRSCLCPRCPFTRRSVPCCRQTLFCSGDLLPWFRRPDLIPATWSVLLPVICFALYVRLISMAASSSSTVNQTEIGGIRTENVPMQVINLRLTKENYFSWSPAMTMGIAARDRMTYIDGSNPEPARTSGVWRTWFLEDNQVKTWIVNSVSPEIQPLILRKKTARDMWVVLEQMYGQKKTDIRTYQVMKTVYNLRQGSSSVAEYYGALKAKWEELDYHSDLPWHCPQDQALHVAQEWKNRVFLFLAGLNDEFEGVRSQILNSGEVFSIEDVYSCIEAEEQRRLVTNEGKRDLVPSHARSAFVSRGSGNLTRSLRRCTHCKKTGHTVDYCWDLHPDKKGTRGRPSSGKMSMTEEPKPSEEELAEWLELGSLFLISSVLLVKATARPTGPEAAHPDDAWRRTE